MPPKQSSSRKMPQMSEDANVKENEETDVDDEGDLKPLTLEFDEPHFVDFQETYPEALRKISGIFHAPASIKIVIEAFFGLPWPCRT